MTTWNSLVQQGRELRQADEEAGLQWRWGDSALQVVPVGQKGAHPRRVSDATVEKIANARAEGSSWTEIAAQLNDACITTPQGKRWSGGQVKNTHSRGTSPPKAQDGVHARLARWADEIGWAETGRTFGTLLGYRDVAHHWPPERRVAGVSQAVHAALKNHPERFELVVPGMPLNDAQELRGRSRNVMASYLPNPSRVIEAMLGDEAYAAKILGDRRIKKLIASTNGPVDVAQVTHLTQTRRRFRMVPWRERTA